MHQFCPLLLLFISTVNLISTESDDGSSFKMRIHASVGEKKKQYEEVDYDFIDEDNAVVEAGSMGSLSSIRVRAFQNDDENVNQEVSTTETPETTLPQPKLQRLRTPTYPRLFDTFVLRKPRRKISRKEKPLTTTTPSEVTEKIRQAEEAVTTTKSETTTTAPPTTETSSSSSAVPDALKTATPNENGEVLLAVLDEDGRVGPNFEVHDQYFLPPKVNSKKKKLKNFATMDTNLLEKENMIIDSSKYNMTELRGLLSEKSNLEVESTDSNRDFGSSFILPVLKRVNYDNNTVPVAFGDLPVHVAVRFNILYLANFDSQLMEYSIDIEMELTWYDLRLANNYSKPIRIREKAILDEIWRPDPYFVNSKFSYFHMVSFPNFHMRISPSGLVRYTMRVTSVCNCFMLLCLYPHDRQTCDLRISSIAYPHSFVQFHWHKEPIRFESPIALPELHVTKLATEECAVEGKLIHSSCLRLIFYLERDGGRFIVEKYIPSTLAMMFAWVAPYVPYNYEDVRIITPITVLLTLVQMEKGDGEIRTSYLTSIDVWFAAMKAFTVISLIESLSVLALIKRSRAMEKYSLEAVNEYDRGRFETRSRHLNRLYHHVDTFARILSPLVFIVFFIYYIVFVSNGNDRNCASRRR